MTFASTGRANRRAESTTSTEIGFVPSNAFAGIQAENPGRVSITPKLASFRQMPLQADQQPPQERDETHETPAKTGSGPWQLPAWQPRRQLTDNPHDRRSNRLPTHL
jgi:hypothetical protein